MTTNSMTGRRSGWSRALAVLAATALRTCPVAAQPYAYVANLGSATVSVVDVATQSVAATVPVGSNPDGVAATPDGTRVFVANFLSDDLSVIDTSTNTVIARIDVGSGPVGVAVRPDGTFAYVTNRGSNTVSVVSVATNALVATIPVGAGPDAVAITPDGAFAYVTNSFTHSPGTVSALDLRTNTVKTTVEVYRTPNRVAITPDGRFAYVANFNSWNIAVIDTSSNTVTATLPLFGRPSGVAVHPNGASAYVVTLGGTVEVIETATNTITNVITVGDTPYGIATTRNGGAGYVTNFAAGSLTALDLGDEVSTATVAVGAKPFAVAVNCVGSGCTEPAYTPHPTRPPTATGTATETPTATPTRPPTFTPTPLPSPIRLEMEPVNGLPGQQVTVTVSLRTEGQPVVATQSDLSFDANVPIAALPSGKPDCALNPAIDKSGTTFLFEPVGCEHDVTCTAVRALVVSFDNVDLIPDGAVLYTCNVRIGTGIPPGAYALTIVASGSDPSGGALTAALTGGYVVVGTPPEATPISTFTQLPTRTNPPAPTVVPTPTIDLAHAAVIHIGSATGAAGQRVQVSVTVDTKGLDISGIQNDITFDPRAAVAARANGRPDCTVNPAINKNASAFAFQPPSCTLSGDCNRLRALIIAIDNGDSIPDGAVLYTCNVDIAASAPPGTYPLGNVDPLATSPEAIRVSAVGTDGQVSVTGPSGQRGLSTSGAASASSGCQTVEPSSGGASWLLLAAGLLLTVRRRQHSGRCGARR